MSRHEVKSVETGQFTVIVGWDHPLQTYFAQVWDAKRQDEEDDGCVFWVGTHPGSVRSVSDLARVISGYAVLPQDLVAELEREQAESEPPTPLQQWVSARLGPESTGDEQDVGAVKPLHEHPCFECRRITNRGCGCDSPDDWRHCEDCDRIPF